MLHHRQWPVAFFTLWFYKPVQALFWIAPDAILSGRYAYGYWLWGDEINTTHCKLQHGDTARQPHEMTVDEKYHLSLLWQIWTCACETVQMRLYLFPFVESVWMCLFVFLFWWQVCHFPNVITWNLFLLSLSFSAPVNLWHHRAADECFCSSASGNICKYHLLCQSLLCPSFLFSLVRTHTLIPQSFYHSSSPCLSFPSCLSV